MTGNKLLEAAKSARTRAYAPYSGFRVGAAVETEDGSVFTGANVESASYSLTNCAERVALQTAVAAGHRRFLRILVVADTDAPVSPCGACRQVMAEFAADAEVVLANVKGAIRKTTVAELLPGRFTPSDLHLSTDQAEQPQS